MKRIPDGAGAPRAALPATNALIDDSFHNPQGGADLVGGVITDEPLGDAVVIVGSLFQGSTLTASTTLSDADGIGDITYRWFADGEDAGAGLMLTLEQWHVGKRITVTASFINSAGALTTVESSDSRPVTDVNLAPALVDPSPVLLATDVEGDPVAATGVVSGDDPDGDALQYSVAGGVADDVSGLITVTGAYGTLELDSGTGEFTYLPDAERLQAATRGPVELFLVSLSDGEFSDSAVLEVGLFEDYVVDVVDSDGDGMLWNADFLVSTGAGLPAEDLQLFRTYEGVLGRAPDSTGFAFYRDAIADGAYDLYAMTAGFLWSDEFMSFFPGVSRPTEISSADFVNHVYASAFGREPDEAGFAYWTGELDSGARDQVEVAISMTQSNEFVALTVLDAADYLLG